MYKITQEINGLYTHSIKSFLHKRIKADVKCKIVDNMLITTIIAPKGIIYRYTWNNIYNDILYGMSSEIVAQDILKGYKKHINNLYFF